MMETETCMLTAQTTQEFFGETTSTYIDIK